VATQVFAEEELERLRGFPEIGREELFRFFTLPSADVAFVDPGRGRGPADRLGLAVALCTLPWLGFVPDDVAAAPSVAVARLADQLHVDPTVLGVYGRRAKTRTEHLRLVAQYRGWRLPTELEFKELDEFLLARALEHDSPTLLFRLACEYLISVRVIRPGLVTVLERVAHARAQAQRETYDRLAGEFSEQRRAGLDGLLVVDPEVGMTRLRWLTTGAVEASPAGVKAEVGKLEFLRGLGADALDLSVLPAERRRFLATVGRRLTAQALARREPQRRYPILLTLLAQSATDVLDEVVSLFDQAVSAREGKAERTMRDTLAERGKTGEDRQALLDELLDIIADPAIGDEQIGALIRGERIGWTRIRAAMVQAVPRLPRDHGHLAALDGSYGYLRQFTPQVLAAVAFAGGTAAAELLAAVVILRELNATGARRVPDTAPTGSCRRGGAAIWTRPRRRGTRARIGTTGSCAPCWRCATGCAPAMSTCPARAATPIPPPTCSLRTSGRCSGRSSANWSANPPTPHQPWLRRRTSWPTRSASSSRSSPPVTARCAWTRTAIWSSRR